MLDLKTKEASNDQSTQGCTCHPFNSVRQVVNLQRRIRRAGETNRSKEAHENPEAFCSLGDDFINFCCDFYGHEGFQPASKKLMTLMAAGSRCTSASRSQVADQSQVCAKPSPPSLQYLPDLSWLRHSHRSHMVLFERLRVHHSKNTTNFKIVSHLELDSFGPDPKIKRNCTLLHFSAVLVPFHTKLFALVRIWR